MNSYPPGQSLRLNVTATSIGVLVDLTSLGLVVHYPDGSRVSLTPIHDALGAYHADIVVPANMGPGIAVARWSASGTNPAQNAVCEHLFAVHQLGF